jgi:hypothetical protein
VTSWTNLAPVSGARLLPPEPVMNMRQLLGLMPASDCMRRKNSSTFSGCLVSWRW